MGTSTRAIVRERLTMKFTAALLTLTAAERNGKTDAQGIHIGGGAFDAGTPEGVALWAIRKCRKKICHSWSFGRCPINDIGAGTNVLPTSPVDTSPTALYFRTRTSEDASRKKSGASSPKTCSAISVDSTKSSLSSPPKSLLKS